MRIEALSGWTSEQRHVVAACFLGWTLDAFDFFLLVFVLKDIAQEFNTQITEVTFAILLTLAMRPVGAYLFGRAADRWGRRPTLMVNILLYSFIEFRRILIRARSRPVGTPTHLDGQHSVVFVHRIRVRLRAKPHRPRRRPILRRLQCALDPLLKSGPI